MSNGLAFIASVALAANEELERIAPLLMSKTETKRLTEERLKTFVDDASQPVKRKRGRPKKHDRKPNEDENYELQNSNSKKTKKEDRYVDISFLPSSKHIDHSLIIWDDRKRSKPKKYTVDGEESDEERQVPNSQRNPPELQATANVQSEVLQSLHPPVQVEKPKKLRVVKPKPPAIVDPNNPDAPLKRPRGRPRKNPDELSVPRKKPNSLQTTQTPNGSVEQVTQVYSQPPRSALEEAVLPSVLLNGLVQMSQPTLLNSLPTTNVTAVKKLPKPNTQPGEQPRKRGRPRKYPLPAGQPAPRPKSVNQAVLPPASTPLVPFSLPSPSFPIVQNVSYNATPPIALPPLKFDLPTPQTQVALPPLKQMSIHTLVQSDSEPKPLPILSGIQSLYSEHPPPKPVAQAQIQEAPPPPPSPQALSPVQPESPPPLESTRASNDQAATTNGACVVPLKKRFVKNYDLTPRMGGHLINSLVPHESAATAH